MFDIDWMYLLVCFGLVFTGAAFFGFPLGWAVAKRTFHDETSHLPPRLIKAIENCEEARRRDQDRECGGIQLSREDTILLADTLEAK